MEIATLPDWNHVKFSDIDFHYKHPQPQPHAHNLGQRFQNDQNKSYNTINGTHLKIQLYVRLTVCEFLWVIHIGGLGFRLGFPIQPLGIGIPV